MTCSSTMHLRIHFSTSSSKHKMYASIENWFNSKFEKRLNYSMNRINFSKLAETIKKEKNQLSVPLPLIPLVQRLEIEEINDQLVNDWKLGCYHILNYLSLTFLESPSNYPLPRRVHDYIRIEFKHHYQTCE